MRFPKELADWVKLQAQKKRTTITQVFVEAVKNMKEAKNDDRTRR